MSERQFRTFDATKGILCLALAVLASAVGGFAYFAQTPTPLPALTLSRP